MIIPPTLLDATSCTATGSAQLLHRPADRGLRAANVARPISTTTSARCAARSSHTSRLWRTAHSVERASIRKEPWQRFTDGRLTATQRTSISHFTPTTRTGTAAAVAAPTAMVRPARMRGWSSNNRSKWPGGTVPTLAAAAAAVRAAVGARWAGSCSCTTTMRSGRGELAASWRRPRNACSQFTGTSRASQACSSHGSHGEKMIWRCRSLLLPRCSALMAALQTIPADPRLPSSALQEGHG